jgi:hypothetical protein
MAFVLIYNSILQVIAAFVVFLFAYVALFVSLIICLVVAVGIYECAKWVQAYLVNTASASRSASSDAALSVHRQKSSVILAWTHKLIDGLAPGR